MDPTIGVRYGSLYFNGRAGHATAQHNPTYGYLCEHVEYCQQWFTPPRSPADHKSEERAVSFFLLTLQGLCNA